MHRKQAGVIDLNYGNLETTKLHKFNILLDDAPAVFDLTTSTKGYLIKSKFGKYKTYSSELREILTECNDRILYEYLGEAKFVYGTETKACKQNSWAFVLPTTASLVLFNGTGAFYTLPIPMPIHDELLFPLAGTWAGKNIVIFYKNLTDETVHAATFELKVGSDTPTLHLVQTVKTSLKIKYKKLIPACAYYFDIEHTDLEGIFLLKFPQHHNLFVITNDFKTSWTIAAQALVATKNFVTILTHESYVFCANTAWFVEQLQEEEGYSQFQAVYSSWHASRAHTNVKVITFPEHKHFIPKLAVYGDDTYLLKSCRYPFHAIYIRIDHSFKLILNEHNKKFTVYKRNLQDVVESFVRPKERLLQVSILSRNVQLNTPQLFCSCSNMGVFVNKIRYFLKMDVITGWS